MSVDKIFLPLKYVYGRARKEIQGQAFRHMASAANALYEALFDDKTPGTATQTIKGHDHAENGGGPFIRGLCWGVDTGTTPFWSWTPTEENDIDFHVQGFARYPVSPFLDEGGQLECTILYLAEGSDFELTLTETESGSPHTKNITTKLKKTGEAEGDGALVRHTFFIPLSPGALNGLYAQVTNKSYSSENEPNFKLYSFSFAETAKHSYHLKGRAL